MDTLSAPNSQERLREIETILDLKDHIVVAFKRQCRRYAPEAFTDDELFNDLYNETIYEYVRRLTGFATLPANPAAWLHKYSDEALLRAKEIVWSGSDHDIEGDDFEPAIQRPDRVRHSKRIVDLFADALADHPNRFERAAQAVDIVVHLIYHAGGSGQLSTDRFPYEVMVCSIGKEDLPIDRQFIDWTVDTLANRKPRWAEVNIFGPLDNRRDARTIGDRSQVVAETVNCRVATSVEEDVEAKWVDDDLLPDLQAALRAASTGASVETVVAQLIEAEPWIADAGHDVITQIRLVLIDYGATTS